MIHGSKIHLKEAKKRYFPHLFYAVKWGFFLIYTGILSIIHGVIPAFFPFHAPRNVMKIARMLEERGVEEELRR